MALADLAVSSSARIHLLSQEDTKGTVTRTPMARSPSSANV